MIPVRGARGLRRRVPDAFEILDAISAQRIQNQETLYIPGFIQTSVPLLNLQVLIHKPRHFQRARSLQEQRNAGVRGDAFFQWLWIELKTETRLRRATVSACGEFPSRIPLQFCTQRGASPYQPPAPAHAGERMVLAARWRGILAVTIAVFQGV
jgi:hypothetical protein